MSAVCSQDSGGLPYEMSCSIEDSMSLPFSDLMKVERPGVTQTVAAGMMPQSERYRALEQM
jgi:hypothetical protein